MRRKFWYLLGLVAWLLAGVLCATQLFAATFLWDANTEPDLAGYRLYRSPATPGPTCAGTWVLVKNVGLVTTTTDAPANGLYCYSLTAIDNALVPNESLRSNVVYLQVPTDATPPAMPSGLRVSP